MPNNPSIPGGGAEDIFLVLSRVLQNSEHVSFLRTPETKTSTKVTYTHEHAHAHTHTHETCVKSTTVTRDKVAKEKK